MNHCCIVIRKQELLSDFMERSQSCSRGWGTAQPSPGAERDWEQQLLAGACWGETSAPNICCLFLSLSDG